MLKYFRLDLSNNLIYNICEDKLIFAYKKGYVGMKLEVNEKNINPTHYKSGKIEVIDIIEDQLTEEEYLGFTKGLVMKYVMRSNMKNGLEDLEKAKWYLERLSKYYKNKLEEKGSE